MDVKKLYTEQKLNEYLNWLEIALRAQVVCNAAFSRKFEEIKAFIQTGAHGCKHAKDEFRRKFERLAEMLSAVAVKYHVAKVEDLRAFFLAHRHLK